jgi:lactoylglutathione lyase
MTVLDHVGLSVADLDAEAEWYAQAFGLEQREPGGVPSIDLRTVFLVDPEHGWAIELLHRPDSERQPHASSAPEHVLRQGYGHICLRVVDVDILFTRLLGHGATPIMAPGPAPMSGVRMAFVADPEGNLIEMLDRPGRPGTPAATS